MSTTTSARPAAAKEAPEEVPKKSRLKLVVAVVLAVAVVGGAGWFFLLKGKGADAHPVVEKGVVLPVEAININLAQGHYLKLGFALQLTKDVHENPDPSEALALAIDQFSGAKMAHLGDAKHRREALEKFSTAVQKAYPHEVMEVYPTTFVMQ